MTKTPNGAALLERFKPSPIPAIHPVPEFKAEGDLFRRYQETKQVFRVPWMGVVAMAFAHYPRFYATLWQQLQPVWSSQQFADACQALRSKVDNGVKHLPVKSLEPELISAGYATQELDQIRDLIEVFSRGNMPYLLMATLARLLLEGKPLSEQRQVSPLADNGVIEEAALVLIEPHHANAPLQELFDQIKTTLGLPFVNTDYRALARWPSYFSQAWHGLDQQIRSPLYQGLVEEVHDTAVKLALNLPNPNLLDSAQLQAAAKQDAGLDEVRDVVCLFQYLLPGLVTNIAYFRVQLLPAH